MFVSVEGTEATHYYYTYVLTQKFKDYGSYKWGIGVYTRPSNDTPAPDPDPKPQSLSIIAEKLGTTSDNVSYISSTDMAAPQYPTSRITNALSALSFDIISTQ
ncbi:MAG: hypothetical protein IJP89_06830 [Synergistaceae bacterium]|nr:hypothetical protein [Synergistaceae bacterium]